MENYTTIVTTGRDQAAAEEKARREFARTHVQGDQILRIEATKLGVVPPRKAVLVQYPGVATSHLADEYSAPADQWPEEWEFVIHYARA